MSKIIIAGVDAEIIYVTIDKDINEVVNNKIQSYITIKSEINITIDPLELRGFLTGLDFAIGVARRYAVCEDFDNLIGELEEKIDTWSHTKGYQDWLKEIGKSDE